jgi:hypothetical protein
LTWQAICVDYVAICFNPHVNGTMDCGKQELSCTYAVVTVDTNTVLLVGEKGPQEGACLSLHAKAIYQVLESKSTLPSCLVDAFS